MFLFITWRNSHILVQELPHSFWLWLFQVKACTQKTHTDSSLQSVWAILPISNTLGCPLITMFSFLTF